ncbi:MAG: histidine kinase [Pyrinomonadaceae bacterium]
MSTLLASGMALFVEPSARLITPRLVCMGDLISPDLLARWTLHLWSQSLGGAASLIHLPASILFSLLQLTIETFAGRLIGMPSKSFISLMFNLFSYKFHFNLLTYWAIVGASLAFNYHRRFREEELQRSQLAGQLALAQLQALKTQLHPHFLFNTLNTIASDDPPRPARSRADGCTLE